jgi:hypothetical protein
MNAQNFTQIKRPRGRPRVNRAIVVEAWRVEREMRPGLTKAAFGRSLHISRRTVHRCLVWGIEKNLVPKWIIEPRPVMNIRQTRAKRDSREAQEYNYCSRYTSSQASGLHGQDSRQGVPESCEPSFTSGLSGSPTNGLAVFGI